ncbi:unnamed protein product [Dibothriocephalus latus]|uniref:purine-nucleoside phosphorylase n=1 Tax=Dibothriocephalus latus TaxID=60516 RepID=A0A3P7NC17_DIBLA|nr:unnamed protein product [Dibothriocephalus latus]
MEEYEQTAAACAFIRQHTSVRPLVGIICGSGLGAAVATLVANPTIAWPVRVMKMLGAEYLFATNAAGGMNRKFKPGDMVVIQDHVDFSSLVGLNPLTGPNDESHLSYEAQLSRDFNHA